MLALCEETSELAAAGSAGSAGPVDSLLSAPCCFLQNEAVRARVRVQVPKTFTDLDDGPLLHNYGIVGGGRGAPLLINEQSLQRSRHRLAWENSAGNTQSSIPAAGGALGRLIQCQERGKGRRSGGGGHGPNRKQRFYFDSMRKDNKAKGEEEKARNSDRGCFVTHIRHLKNRTSA